MKGLSSITAAILAGGLGTRLRPVVADRPKVMADVNGRPFLQFLLDRLNNVGLRSVVLCTGYMAGHIRDIFGTCYRNLSLVYSEESSPLGTAGALRFAAPFLQSDHILVMNGDSFFMADLEAFWSGHLSNKANATILLVRSSDTRRFGRVQVDPGGRVLSFDEKDGRRGTGWINAGVYLMKHELLHTIPPTGAVSIERDTFPAWIGRGLYGYKSEGRFLDIGTPEAYAEADLFLASCPETAI